jgi:asparagine synthase (glutamine-hydrolysing)
MMNRDPADPGLWDAGLVKELDLPGYYEDQYRTALSQVPELTGPAAADPRERRMRQICFLYLTRFLPLLLDRKDRMSMAVGLEVRVPFCDHRLVEYVFGTPWAYKTFDGREKSLLRAATADLLPASVVQRLKSPYPSTQDPDYERTLRGQVAALLDSDSPVLALLDPEAVRERLATPVGVARGMAARMRLEQVLTLSDWVRDYDVTIDV